MLKHHYIFFGYLLEPCLEFWQFFKILFEFFSQFSSICFPKKIIEFATKKIHKMPVPHLLKLILAFTIEFFYLVKKTLRAKDRFGEGKNRFGNKLTRLGERLGCGSE